MTHKEGFKKRMIEMGLTEEQIKEIETYPTHWQPTLMRAAKKGESVKETYERLKGFEMLM
jgi:predicted transcriptional regulator